jgi:hypothetical protein
VRGDSPIRTDPLLPAWSVAVSDRSVFRHSFQDGGRLSKTVLAQPEHRRRAAARRIIEDRLGIRPGTGLVVAFGREYRTDAAWLAARARARGAEVGFVAVPAAVAATGAGLGRRLSKACDALRGGCDAVAVVLLGARLADSVDFPPDVDVLQLVPGSAGASPLDMWQEPDTSAAAGAAVEARLRGGSLLRLHTGADAVAVFEYGDADADTDGSWAALVPGDPGVLPADRIRLRVRGASGEFVADGALRVNRPNLFGPLLAHRPVQLTFAADRVAAVHCDDFVLRTFLERAVHVHRLRLVHGVQLAASVPDVGEGGRGPLTAAVRLVVEPEHAYSNHSADLTVDLSAASARLELDHEPAARDREDVRAD